MDLNTCFETTNAYHVIAYYSHLVPTVLGLFLGGYALFRTKFSPLAVFFFAFTVGFSLWLIGDMIVWTSTDYYAVYYFWSWLDFVNIAFFALGAYFFTLLARGKVPLWEKAIYVLLCIPAFVITLTGNSVTEFNHPVCEAINNDWLTVYKLYAEGAITLVMLVSLILAWRNPDRRKRVQITAIFSAIVLFFAIFAGTEYIASVTYVYEINLYGLFVLPLFLMILTFAITDLRLFQLRFVGTQILAYVLIIMVGSQLLFITDSTSRNLALITLAVSLFMGVLLIENAKREGEARQRIEQLARDLTKANSQQVTLIHFITHQIKGFVTKSRNIFSMIKEGDYGTVPETMHPVLNEGFQSDTKGLSTIQEILNAANIKSGKVSYAMEPFDLKTLIEGVANDMKPAADAKSLTLNLHLGDEPVMVTGDAKQLVNAYKNLVDNSIKYTQKGAVDLALTKKSGKAIFTITDTGVGITEEDMQNLFTEGGHGKESTKVNVDSTGFGLYIVKNIIEAHKGRVWGESDGAGKGSRFIIELPS